MTSLILRIIRQIKNDKRTLGLLLFAPLLVLTLISFILSDSGYTPTIAAVNLPDAFAVLLEQDANVVRLEADTDADEYLRANKNVDAVISGRQGGTLHIRMLEASSKTAIVTKAVKNAAERLSPQTDGLTADFIYGTAEQSQFDSLGYVFLGILSFFFVFIVSGMALVRERSAQTLERMMMTPVSRIGVIGGYTLGYGFFAVVQSAVIFLFARYALGLHSAGSVLLCVLIMALMAFAAVSMGALASIFANSEFQVAQLIPVVLVPQVFFSGLIPIDTIPYGIGNLCYIMPVYYGCAALKKVMVEAAGLSDVAPWLAGLLVCVAVLFSLNTLLLKKYRAL